MKKIFLNFLKITPIISIVIICIVIINILYGVWDSYYNGIEKNWLFSGWGSSHIVKGIEGIKVYSERTLFMALIFSFLGIIPIVILPIVVCIIRKIRLKRKNDYIAATSEAVKISLIICILIHIVLFRKLEIWLAVLPYIECILIAWLISYYTLKKQEDTTEKVEKIEEHE